MKDTFDKFIGRQYSIPVGCYLQTTSYTCCAACALMIFAHFEADAFPQTVSKEIEIHNAIKFWNGGDGEYGNYGALAAFALDRGYTVFLQRPRLVKPEFMSAKLFSRYKASYDEWLGRATRHPNCKYSETDFTLETLLGHVQHNRLVLLEIVYPTESCTHQVILTGYNDKSLSYIDPIAGNMEQQMDEFASRFEIRYCKNYIAFEFNGFLESILKGRVARSGIVRGTAKIVNSGEDTVSAQSILVARRTDPDMAPLLNVARGFITDTGGIACHAAIVAREQGKPCIVGCQSATTAIKDGDDLILDADRGLVLRYLMRV